MHRTLRPRLIILFLAARADHRRTLSAYHLFPNFSHRWAVVRHKDGPGGRPVKYCLFPRSVLALGTDQNSHRQSHAH